MKMLMLLLSVVLLLSLTSCDFLETLAQKQAETTVSDNGTTAPPNGETTAPSDGEVTSSTPSVDKPEDCEGHDFGEWIELEAPSCVADGVKKHICRNCEYEERRVISGENKHTYSTNNKCILCEREIIASAGLVYKEVDDGYEVSGYDGNLPTEVVIAPYYNGKPVVGIGSMAFVLCRTPLISIEIPSGVTSIGDMAFYGCESLTNVIIGDGVMNIDNYAFAGCTSLTSITIPNGMMGIGEGVFSGCTSLTDIKISDSVTSIGKGVFSSCANLTSIIVDAGNTVYHSAGNCLIETESKILLFGCKSSIIPNDGSVTRIGEFAFYGFNILTDIVIPDSVTRIDDSAISWSSLTSVYYGGTAEDWSKISIGDVTYKLFGTDYIYYYTEIEPTEDGNYWHYVDGVPTKW
ncbi:MAG: leucine-rich repeat protein [Clostridia bacterium]|nr:leucine-rich repeat protein [Clostridia bacterium]